MRNYSYIIIFIVGCFLTSVNAGPFDKLIESLEEIEQIQKQVTTDSDENENKEPEVETDKNPIQKVTDGKQNTTSIELPANEPGVGFECTLISALPSYDVQNFYGRNYKRYPLLKNCNMVRF